MKDNLIGEKGFEARLQSLCEELAELKARWKRGQRICFWAAAVVLLLCCSVNKLVSESITMTTYYPAPSGVYKRLIATGPGNTILARDSGMVGIGTGLVSPVATLDVGGTGAIKFPVGTSINRPVNPVTGSFRYNTDIHKMEFYDRLKWKTISYVSDSDFSCTGGNTVTDIGGYRIHTFTTSGIFTVLGSGVVDMFVVGGGGGGGGVYNGGGGGGGGIVVADRVPITAGTYNVVVGARGAGGAAAGTAGARGEDSAFNGMIAGGGGGGGSWNIIMPSAGRANNGSGGGTPGYLSYAGAAGNGTGHAGGAGGIYGAGGGGGAGAAGSHGAGGPGGAGGAGAAYAYSGSMVTYAGGGGGAGPTAGGSGGAGGGGYGTGPSGGNPEDGAANTGGGGGGKHNIPGTAGGNGGSGIVIIRYPN